MLILFIVNNVTRIVYHVQRIFAINVNQNIIQMVLIVLAVNKIVLNVIQQVVRLVRKVIMLTKFNVYHVYGHVLFVLVQHKIHVLNVLQDFI